MAVDPRPAPPPWWPTKNCVQLEAQITASRKQPPDHQKAWVNGLEYAAGLQLARLGRRGRPIAEPISDFAFIGFPPVEIVSVDARYPSLGVRQTITLNRLASDERLLELVGEILRRTRLLRSAHAAHRGRPKEGQQKTDLKPAITGQQLDDWTNRKLIRAAELLWWERQARMTVTNADLGRWLFGDACSNPSQEGRRVRDTLNKAIKLMPALWVDALSTPVAIVGKPRPAEASAA